MSPVPNGSHSHTVHQLDDCVFCRYEGPSEVTHINARVYRIEPLNPVTAGHQLFIPYAHVDVLGGIDGLAIGVEVMAATDAAVNYVRYSGIEANVIINIGSAATQTIDHLHVHVVPRREGDGLQLPWTGQTEDLTHVRKFFGNLGSKEDGA